MVRREVVLMGGLNCCCPCVEDCDGSFNSKSNLTFSIASGLHPHSITKPVRVGTSNVTGISWPLGRVRGCLPVTDERNSPGPASLDPSYRNPTTCCYWLGIWPVGTEGDSTFFAEDRAWTETDAYSDSSSGTTACGTVLDYFVDATNVLTASVSVGATRKINEIQMSFCPTVSYLGVREWTVTIDIQYAVIERYRISYYTVTSLDCYTHVEVKPSPPFCAGAYAVKVCQGCCNGSYVSTNCVINRTEYNGGTLATSYTPSVLTTDDPCNPVTVDYTKYAQDLTTVRYQTQRRRVTIPRNCALPDSISFPYSSFVSGTDSGFGWEYIRYNYCFYDLDPYKTYAGDYSDATVYEPLTEEWTVDLT